MCPFKSFLVKILTLSASRKIAVNRFVVFIFDTSDDITAL